MIRFQLDGPKASAPLAALASASIVKLSRSSGVVLPCTVMHRDAADVRHVLAVRLVRRTDSDVAPPIGLHRYRGTAYPAFVDAFTDG